MGPFGRREWYNLTMAWTTSDKVMKLRERSRPFDIFAEMMDGWRRHISGRNASLFAFFSFLSIFPLMLAAVSILGFVLRDNDKLKQDLIDGAASEIPVLGKTLAENPESIDGSVLALVIGVAIALFSATKAFVGLHSAADDAWEVPLDDRAKTPVLRGKALLGLLVIALPQIGNLVLASLVQTLELPALGNIGIIIGTIVMNVAVIALLYRFFTSKKVAWGDVWPGAIIAGLVFTALQSLGPWFVERQAQGDGPESIETINIILGLLGWLSLVGITLIMCAELNAAIKRLSVKAADRRTEELNISLRSADANAS